MADKSIDQLNAAEKVYDTDLFVLQQSGTAKKLTGQVLENWLVSFADGHGGIQSIQKVSTSGLVDTYRITLADTTTFDFVVTNGRSINSISKTSTSGLVDTYTITINDGTTSKFTVTNGAKGDKGDNTYTWVKYASQEPTENSHSIGDIPDEWRGEYNGPLTEAPTDWKKYKWYKVKGDKGDTGAAATFVSKSVSYLVGDSGEVTPSGAWSNEVPAVPQGKFLWTRTIVQFNTGDPITSYSVARMGIDGAGTVSSVNGKSPDDSGNVSLTAANVGALPLTGGTMTGTVDMGGKLITNLPEPTSDGHAARKAYVDSKISSLLSSGAVQITKLWENPKTGSTFVSQTLSMDLTGYRFVIITARATTTSSVYASWACLIGRTQSISAYTTKFNFRQVTVSSTGVSFGTGKFMPSYGASYTDDDTYTIPVVIYGVK